MWKRGWNFDKSHLHANTFVTTESLLWAATSGFSVADIVGVSPRVASAVLAGRQLNVDEARTRDVFSLRLGARPKFLPPAQLLVLNPGLRAALDLGFRAEWVRRRLFGGGA
jgi:hypothetical protein